MIKKEKISKIKKFKEGLYFEDWLVELEPNVTKSRVTEAFAKVVKGFILNDLFCAIQQLLC